MTRIGLDIRRDKGVVEARLEQGIEVVGRQL